MERFVFYYRGGRYQWEKNPDDILLARIVNFLNSDVGYYRASSFKKSLFNTETHTIHCNEHRLEKENDVIRISDDYIDDEDERLFYSVEIKRDELARVLDQWDEICKTMPPYIIIIRDGETITLHGCETLDEN